MRKIAAKRLRKFAYVIDATMKNKHITRRQLYHGLKKEWTNASQAERGELVSQAETVLGLRG